MDVGKVNQILRVAKMYYEMGMGQRDIGEKEKISKSTVSRLLKNAEVMGFVKITVEKPMYFMADIEEALCRRYGLKKAVITPLVVNDRDVILADVCRSAAAELPSLIRSDSVVAVAWGRTLTELAGLLPPMKRTGVKVVQINGGSSRLLYDTGSDSVLKAFKDAVDGEAYRLAAPAVVDNIFIAEAIKSDSQIRSVIDTAENADIGIWSVGKVAKGSILYELVGFSESDFARIKKLSDGDVCSHYLNASGKLADEAFDGRVVAASAEKLRNIPDKVLVAAGADKADAVRASLNGGFADYLFIDEALAKKVLKSS